MEHAFPIRYTFLVLESETGNAGQVILNTYLDKNILCGITKITYERLKYADLFPLISQWAEIYRQ